MRPLRLTLTNFTGIRAGLGRDEIDIDLSGYHGLVALTGPNGIGKTTLLDNFQPYRLCAFRAGGYTPGSFSYYDHTYGEAAKTLEFTHGGERYRSSLLIRGANKTKKTEAYLQVHDGRDWVPVELADGTVSDGKTVTYDACVDRIVGTPEMFFTGVFASQGRRPLSEYAVGDIKGLLTELLGLDHILALRDRAREVVKGLEHRFAGMQGQVQEAEAQEAEAARLGAAIAAGEAEVEQRNTERKTKRDALTTATRTLAEAEAQAANQQALAQRRAAAQASLTAIDQRVNSQRTALDADLARERQRLGKTRADEQGAALTARIARQRGELARQQAVIGRADEIEAATARAAALTADLESIDSEIHTLRTDLDGFAALRAEHAGAKEKLTSLSSQGKALAEQVKGLHARGALVERVPCAGLDIHATCPLLADAHTAADQAGAAQTKLDQARAAWSALDTAITDMDARLAGADAIQAKLTDASDRQRAVNADLAAARAAAGLKGALDAAREAVAAITQDIADTEQAQAAHASERDAAVAEGERIVADLTVRIEALAADAESQRKTLQDELAKLPAPGAEDAAVKAAEADQDTADRALNAAEQAIATANRSLAEDRAALDATRKRLRQAAAGRQLAARVRDEIAHWNLLAQALGNDGVIALSIDDAGPSIAAIANDLLLTCYGHRFSIAIDTQRENKAGTMKETFDITVFDAEAGDAKTICAMSGGERIWINEALTRGIALFQAGRSNHAYQCLFSDESDGALDAERKEQLVHMKRRVMQIGGYDTEFFVSHTPELWALADHVIDVAALRAQ